MASSLFSQGGGNTLLAAVSQLKAMGNPQSAYNNLYHNNPQFRQFADSMQGKTPQQAFRENGLDYDQVKGLFN